MSPARVKTDEEIEATGGLMQDDQNTIIAELDIDGGKHGGYVNRSCS